MPKNVYTDLDKYVRACRDGFEARLARIVEIPTISMEPDRKADIRRGAQLACDYLKSAGAQAEIVETPGNPVVLGKFWTGAGNPTLTIYNHIDVQPADPSEWHKAPFIFYKHDGIYEGRGTTDDKGPALVALEAARYSVDNGIPPDERTEARTVIYIMLSGFPARQDQKSLESSESPGSPGVRMRRELKIRGGIAK